MELLKKIAENLDGMMYMDEPSEEFIRYAKENNIVIVFGYSDDNVELRGAIEDEIYAYDEKEFYINGRGVINPSEYDGKCADCVLFDKYIQECKKIIAKYDEDLEYLWVFDTDIPHECFDVLDHPINNMEKFCKGIVFSLDNLGSSSNFKNNEEVLR